MNPKQSYTITNPSTTQNKFTLQGLKQKKIKPPLNSLSHTFTLSLYALIHPHIQSSPVISEPDLLNDCSRSPNHDNP